MFVFDQENYIFVKEKWEKICEILKSNVCGNPGCGSHETL